LHKSWKCLATSCNKNVKKLYPVIEFNIGLPVEFFGNVDLHNRPLKRTQCAVFDILKRIGDALFQIESPGMFATEATIRRNDRGERIYSDFCTGDFFHSVDKVVKAEHGNDAVALCLHFSMDGTGCNASGSVQKCPLVMWIGNATVTDRKIYLLGYVQEALPYDDAYLDALLIKRNCLIACDRDAIIKYAKLQQVLDYVHAALVPIINIQRKNGFVVTIGQGITIVNISFALLTFNFIVKVLVALKSVLFRYLLILLETLNLKIFWAHTVPNAILGNVENVYR